MKQKRLFCLTALLLAMALAFLSCGAIPGKIPFRNDGPVTSDPVDVTDPIAPPEDTPSDDNLITYDSAVLINEVCSKSTDTATGGYDWIELYNKTDTAQDVSGWRLSDSKKEPARYVFPAGTEIPAHGYLLVWAVGADVVAKKPDELYYAPFKISNEGEKLYLSTSEEEMADILNVPGLRKDTTYGRSEDGGTVFATLTGSRGASNSGTVYLLAKSVLSFSSESGFYDDAFSLTISAPAGYDIFYTLDCTDPATSAGAVKYSAPIPVFDPSGAPGYSADYFGAAVEDEKSDGTYVDKCFVVRAVAFDPDGNATRTVTKNYFVGYGDKAVCNGLSVLTMTADPEQIYGTTGLFPNYSVEGLEKQVNMTLLTSDGTYDFDREVGIQIRGSSTRSALQKNLNIYARAEYDGNSVFPDSLFPDAAFTKSLVLRQDNMSLLHLDQGFLQDAVADRELSTQDSMMVAVFIDGEYFGLYNLYERFSDDYVEAHYGVEDDNVWIVKFGRESDSSEALVAYREMYDYMVSTDLSVPANFARLCEMVDMQSLIDLYCTHLYYDNGDFSMSQNISAWRAADTSLVDSANPYADGKWRFVIFDLDYAMDGPAQMKNAWMRDTFTVVPKNEKLGPAFLYWDAVKSLVKSATFKELFVTTFMDMANVNFDYESNIKPMMDASYNLIYQNVLPFLSRYNRVNSAGRLRTADDWGNRTKLTQFNFMENRKSYIVGFLADNMGLTGTLATLTVASEGGDIHLNTVTLPMGEDGLWSGQYYTDYSVKATAEAREGYTFARWETSGGVSLRGSAVTDATVTVAISGTGGTLRAVYTEAR